jgi:hypothetical protein
VIITSYEFLEAAVAGGAGTHIVPGARQSCDFDAHAAAKQS